MIAEEFKNSDILKKSFFIYSKNLQVFTPETDGTPVRSLIISTWRSGSTFLGDILESKSGSFYFFEPLIFLKNLQVRSSPTDELALNHIEKLLNCNFTGMDAYLDFARESKYLFTYNKLLWKHCNALGDECFKPEFLEPFCKLFPVQSMKLVRLRMKVAAKLLANPKYTRE